MLTQVRIDDMAVADVTERNLSCLVCDAECFQGDPDIFICNACESHCHFACGKFPFDKPNKATAKVFALAPVRLLCPICADGPARHSKGPKTSLESKVDKLSSIVSRLSEFLDPVIPTKASSTSTFANPASSFASVTASGLHRPPKNLAEAMTVAAQTGYVKAQKADESKKCVVMSGIELAEGEDPAPRIQVILECLKLDKFVRVERCSVLRSSQHAAAPISDQPRKPPLIKVLTASPDHASALLKSSKELKDAHSPWLTNVYIRPDRLPEEARLLKRMLQRRDALSKSETAPNTRYAICYRKSGFPILKFIADKPDWSWVDEGFEAWALAQTKTGSTYKPTGVATSGDAGGLVEQLNPAPPPFPPL
jgi:hypothetical protein